MTKRRDLHLSHSADVGAEYEALVRAAADGGQAAMERLLMRVQSVAFRFSLLVCGNPQDAEDVMQEALLKTYRHVKKIERPEAFRTWLFRTVRNFCLMKRRKRVDEPAHVESLDGTMDATDKARRPDEVALNAWLGKRLRAALAGLAPVDRMIVLLREMEGLSTREGAEITTLSEDNVKTRLHRARVRLRELLKEA
ncbi:MAG: RNA polymerase sigma factor [Acidobacteria bacterium]|nr:RNA polymerase sigma factor [Acidobacteriota bacterium]